MSNSTKRNIVLSAILFVLCLAGSGFMVVQVNEQGIRLDEQITTLQEERAQEQSYLRLQRQAEETEADRATLRQYFLIRESDSIDFLNLVEAAAPEAGVTLNTNSLEAVSDSSNESTWIKASFTFQGSRVAVERFVEILETVPYVSQVTSVDLSAQSSSEWQANVVMQVRVLNYDE